MEKTNYVIVTNYTKGMTLDEAFLLGWDNYDDWYDDQVDSYDIMTPAGNIKRNRIGIIDISDRTVAYASSEAESCIECAKEALKEDFNCTVCKLEKTKDQYDYETYLLVPVNV